MRKKILAAVASAAVLLTFAAVAWSSVTAGNTGWRWGNPLPQGADLTTLEMSGNRGYAGGKGGTLLRTDDAGATWTTVRTGLLDDIQMVRSVGADTVIFAGNCALRRSDDGGNTVRRLVWTQSEASCSPSIKSFHFPDANAGYLMLTNGDVYSTADGGASWTKRTAIPGTAAKGGNDKPADIWFTSAGNGVASAGGMIYRTTDSASSWSPVGGPYAALNRFDFVNANAGVVTGEGKLFLTTPDGGASWTPQTVNAGPSVALGQPNCHNPNNCVVAAADGSNLYITPDGGANWTSISPSTAPLNGVGFSSATRIVAVGNGGATVASDDGGVTWAPVSGGVDGRFRSLVVKSSSTAYAFGDQGALARTTNGGASWSSIGVATANSIGAVDFPTAERGYVLDQLGVLLRTSNAGGSWQFLGADGIKARTLRAIDKDTVLLVGPKGIYRSTNGGDAFSRAAGKGLAKARLDRCDKAGSVLVCYKARGGGSAWLGSPDGRVWRSFKLPKKVSVSQLDMVTSRAGFALSTKRELYVTRNGGRKWSRVETTGTTQIDTIAFADLRNGYLLHGSGRILMTADGGKTWSRQYPFYDDSMWAPLIAETAGAKDAFMLINGTNRFYSTTTAGAIGVPSTLTIKPSSRKVRRNTTIRVTGTLSPAVGGEQVSIVARPVGSRNGANWIVDEVAVDANGRFTSRWKIKKPTIFTARWSGDSGHDGDGATSFIVKLK